MPLDPMMVPTPVLAALCGVSVRRVQQLADEGVLRSETRGTWDALSNVPAFHAHRIAQVEAAAAKRTGSAADRHVNAKARAIELKTAREEGVLCDTTEAVAVVEEVVGTIRAGLGGLAARCTRDLGLRAVIEGEIDNTLERASVLLGRRAAELRRGGAAAPAEPDEPTAEPVPASHGVSPQVGAKPPAPPATPAKRQAQSAQLAPIGSKRAKRASR